ncbi:L10-interacting MYB domain-containing protein-like [Triticum dicoccoides]|uniref:L10-interacting MYB domain-containing protein-like n=1 Tax=Triticum dicoccoides TaxID=85692 RepID=UPI00188EE7C7|nr:L10-interacting MYB domain-containing protein-like [Triticum dicoccoides]
MEKEKANWDAHHITIFYEICKDEVDAGNRPKGCLNRRGYTHLEDKFFDRTRKRCSQNQFKNKRDMLKRQYVQFMLLKNAATGLGWDDVNKTIIADDDWWKIHLKKNPKHAKYKKKGLANLEEIRVMFANAHVTGATSSITGEMSDNTNDDDMPDVGEESEEDGNALKEVKVSPKDGKAAKEVKVSPKDGRRQNI